MLDFYIIDENYMPRNNACFNKSADFGRSSGFNSRQRMPRSRTSTVSPSGIGGLSVAVAICKHQYDYYVTIRGHKTEQPCK